MSAAATLGRTHFSIGRAAEYFDAKELQAQTGRPVREFADVVLKELVDNALDAAETAGVAPEIAIVVERDDDVILLTVADNGPGLPAELLARILDFDTRTSDKSRYRSPTRGAQGNALKTVIGIPTALGGDDPILIEACGIRHTIRPRIDTAGNVDVGHTVEEIGATAGTAIMVALPAAGQAFAPYRWADAFALANPHVSIKIGVSGSASNRDQSDDGGPAGFYHYPPTVAFPAPWTKWLPTDPTSPHWYDAGAFQALVDAEIAHGRATGAGSKLLRDFVREFAGLTSTVKAKGILAAVPDAKRLADLNGDAASLLGAMRTESRIVKPAALGWVGEAHVRARFDAEYDIVMDRFWYHRVTVMDGGVPIVIEAAVAETEESGGLITAVNFSPTFDDPLAGTLLDADNANGYGIGGFLRDCDVWVSTNAAAFVHLVCPSLTFLDRGKSRIVPSSPLREAATTALWRVARTHWTEGKQREKDAGAAARQRTAMERVWQAATPKPLTLIEAAIEVMEQAWRQATSNGTRPASARTLFYQARPLMQQLTPLEITDTYFTQKLLPVYQRDVKALPGVYYEPRGTLYEPHTGTEVPLGTMDVEGYHAPEWVYDKVLFIEKTGLWPVLKDAQLAERYDMAVIAGSGLATVAARTLLARAERECRLFALHDADWSGYTIAATLAKETARMPDHRIEVIDLGLTLDDALTAGLATETVSRRAALPARLVPHLGETERRMWKTDQKASKDHPVVCERVELNAFTSAQLIAYIEAGLARYDATAKVVPDSSWIREEAAAALTTTVEGRVEKALASLISVGAITRTLTDDVTLDPEAVTPDAIRADLERDRVAGWRDVAAAVGTQAADAIDDDEIQAAVRDAIAEASR